MQQAARVLGYVNLHIFMNSKKVPCHNNFYLKISALNSRMESMWKLINFPLYLSLMSGFSALKQGPRKRQNDIKSSGALVPLEAPERATSPRRPHVAHVRTPILAGAYWAKRGGAHRHNNPPCPCRYKLIVEWEGQQLPPDHDGRVMWFGIIVFG